MGVINSTGLQIVVERLPTTSSRFRSSACRGGITMKPLAFLLLFPCLFLGACGIKVLYTSTQFRSPTTLTYDQFVKQSPKSGWYTITGAEVDIANSVYWDESGVSVYVYAPLRSSRGGETDIYVEVTDHKTQAAFQDLTYARKKGGDAGAREFASRRRDIFFQKRDVSGLVSFGRRDPMGEWSRAGLDAANTTFIEDGWKPNPALGYVGTIVGLILSALCLVTLGKGSRVKG